MGLPHGIGPVPGETRSGRSPPRTVPAPPRAAPATEPVTVAETRTAFIVSDRTGLTAAAMAHSLMAQFPSIDFRTETFTFVDTPAKARDVVSRCREAEAREGDAPLVFVTLVDERIRGELRGAGLEMVELFETFIGPLEKRLGVASSHTVGRSHGIGDERAYSSRIAAVHFALQTDDGLDLEHYGRADLIVVGVSRCGKTPVSLYLSLHYGIYVSNYPLTGEELGRKTLPPALEAHRDRLFALTIDPARLAQIRRERLPGSAYAEPATCQREVAQAESLFRANGVPLLNTTRMSVEEIGAMIVHRTGTSARV